MMETQGTVDSPASSEASPALGDRSGSSDSSSIEPGTSDAAEAAATHVAGDFFARYEAESPQNTRTYPVEGITTEGAPACAGVPGTSSDGVKEGANCASAGHVVNQILGRSPCSPPTSATSYTDCGDRGGGITFNGVTAPADAIYDVTFWYHSGGEGGAGKADTYGDTHCGGIDYGTGAGSGCRPHLIFVNGVQLMSTVGGQNAMYYQFPAYPGSWAIVHGAVVAVPLKAGSNTIYIKAPGFMTSDAADIDALDVQPSGLGAPVFQASGEGSPPDLPMGLITPVLNWD